MRSYKETVAYLFNKLPVYQRIGTAAFKKDLTNIQALVSHLNNPHKGIPYIHIAGTNGKGTTAHMMASVLQESGLKVGLYTSPHYVDFRERIKVNGEWIAEDYVVEFVANLDDTLTTVQPSFFEITVAMAFAYFKSEQVDIAVIETGLGGRLDSTNIIDPILSIITNISLDHVQMLGPDIYIISKEKAGIIKKDRPIVIGKYQSECDQVFMHKAKTEEAQLTWASLGWSFKDGSSQAEPNKASFRHATSGTKHEIALPDNGPFTIANIMTALEGVRVYNNLEFSKVIDKNTIEKGIEKFKANSNYYGRWQILQSIPLIIADSAHNYDALKIVLSHISKGNYKKVHFVIGFVSDKDVDKVLDLFDVNQVYYFTKPAIFRGMPVSDLAETAEQKNLRGKTFTDVPEAIDAAIDQAGPDDLVYVGGSSFVVADALAYIKLRQ